MDFRNRFATFGDQQIDFHWRKLEFQGRLTGEGGHVGRAFCLRGKFEDATVADAGWRTPWKGQRLQQGAGSMVCSSVRLE